MNFETFQIFCDVVELKSFSKTAEKHLVSQSAVSQQLAHLETDYKCQFLDRSKRPIELTGAGELFYAACKDIISRAERLKSDLQELKKSSKSRINVAAIFSIGMHSLPEYTKKFMARYPDVHVHIEYLSSARIYELVLGGKVDIGLVAVPRKDQHLSVYRIQEEPLVVVCSPEHPFAAFKIIDIHRLNHERFISFETDVPTRILIDNILHQYKVTVRTMMEFDNIETVKRAVELNSGISILPATAVTQELALGTLRSVAFTNEHFVRPTGIILRRDKTLSEAGRYLLELLQKME